MSITSRPALRSLALAATLALAGTTNALALERFDFDFTNIYSFGEKGDAGNSTLTFDLGPDAQVVRIDWNVDLTAFEPSWLDEMTLELTNDIGEGFALRPLSDVADSGTGSAAGSFSLLNAGLAFSTRDSGQLNFEFFEFFDDAPDMVDGRWNAGSIGVIYATATSPIPEPAPLALFAAGVAGLVARRRLAQRART